MALAAWHGGGLIEGGWRQVVKCGFVQCPGCALAEVACDGTPVGQGAGSADPSAHVEGMDHHPEGGVQGPSGLTGALGTSLLIASGGCVRPAMSAACFLLPRQGSAAMGVKEQSPPDYPYVRAVARLSTMRLLQICHCSAQTALQCQRSE